MWTPVNFTGRTLKHYGFGWYLNEMGGQRIVLHGGGRPGTSTQFTRFLDAKLTVVVLTNRSGANSEEMAHEIARFYIDGLPPYQIQSIEHPPQWDAGGNLVRELHADGGTVGHAYDAFGNNTLTTAA